MSRKPALGSNIVDEIVDVVNKYGIDGRDVNVINVGGNKLPLGRTIKEKIRDGLHIEKENPQNSEYVKELQRLRREETKEGSSIFNTPKDAYQKRHTQEFRNQSVRLELSKRRQNL
jgi:hypothetical protein